MSWDPWEFGNITKVLCPADEIWVPDLVMYFNEDVDDKVEYKKYSFTGETGDWYISRGKFFGVDNSK